MAAGKGPGNPDYSTLRSERRKELRRSLLVLKVKAEDAKGVFFGYAKNLNSGGLFISSVSPRKTGDEFEISFKLASEAIEARCRCRVAWTRQYDPRLKLEPGMGLHPRHGHTVSGFRRCCKGQTGRKGEKGRGVRGILLWTGVASLRRLWVTRDYAMQTGLAAQSGIPLLFASRA